MKKTLYFAILSLFIGPVAYGAFENCDFLMGDSVLRMYRCGNIKVLKLKGSPQEKGQAVGKLIKKGLLSTKMFEFYSGKIERAVNPKPDTLSFLDKTKIWFLKRFFNILYPNTIKKHSPEVFDELMAMSKAANIPFETIKRSFIIPDAGTLGIPFLNFPFSTFLKSLPTMGCTSVAFTNKDNEFFYGRNLDYSGVGVFDKFPIIVIRYPYNKERLKTVSFAAEGLFFPSITAFNEAGLTFSLHQLEAKKGSSNGMPVLSLGNQVLPYSNTLKQALETIQKNPTGVVWKVNLSNLNTGEVVRVFTSNDIFESESFVNKDFVTTNHFVTEKGKSLQMTMLPSMKNSLYRFNKATNMLKNRDEMASLKTVSDILSYQTNENNPQVYDDILKPQTIHTIYWESDLKTKRKNVYFSESRAPSTLGSFLKFNFKDLFKNFDSDLSFKRVSFHSPKRHKRESQKSIVYEGKDFDKKLSENLHWPFLYKAFHHFKNKKYKKSLKVLRENKGKGPKYIQESAFVLEQINEYRLGNKEQAHKAIKNKAYCDPHWENKLEKHLTKPNMDKKLKYNIFIGGLFSGFYLPHLFKNCEI